MRIVQNDHERLHSKSNPSGYENRNDKSLQVICKKHSSLNGNLMVYFQDITSLWSWQKMLRTVEIELVVQQGSSVLCRQTNLTGFNDDEAFNNVVSTRLRNLSMSHVVPSVVFQQLQYVFSSFWPSIAIWYKIRLLDLELWCLFAVLLGIHQAAFYCILSLTQETFSFLHSSSHGLCIPFQSCCKCHHLISQVILHQQLVKTLKIFVLMRIVRLKHQLARRFSRRENGSTCPILLQNGVSHPNKITFQIVESAFKSLPMIAIHWVGLWLRREHLCIIEIYRQSNSEVDAAQKTTWQHSGNAVTKKGSYGEVSSYHASYSRLGRLDDVEISTISP